jgi:hypothetical protein
MQEWYSLYHHIKSRSDGRREEAIGTEFYTVAKLGKFIAGCGVYLKINAVVPYYAASK